MRMTTMIYNPIFNEIVSHALKFDKFYLFSCLSFVEVCVP